MRKLLIGLCAALLSLASVPAFANTLTTNYSLNKPTIGADSNTWGTLTNANWDNLDALIFGIQGKANAACPKSGCTYTGSITVPGLTATGKMNWAAAVAAYASANCPNGANPTTPATGDLWCVGGKPFYYDGATTHTLAFLDSNVASASQWQTARTETLTGDVTGSVSGINGAGNWNIATTLANSGVGAGTYGNNAGTAYPLFTVDSKGRVTGASSVAITFAPNAGHATSAGDAGTVGGQTIVHSAFQLNAQASTCTTYGHTFAASVIPIISIQYPSAGTNIASPIYVSTYDQNGFCVYNPNAFSGMWASWIAAGP